MSSVRLAFCVPLTLLLVFLPDAVAQSARKPAGFPLPKQIVPVAEAVTPHEYDLIIEAIKVEQQKPEVRQEEEQGPSLGRLDLINATPVRLGALGQAAMVEFSHAGSCGNGGCPMWLLVATGNGYRVAIRAAGWGFDLIPSGRGVPDVAFYWNRGGGGTVIQRSHYAEGKFGPSDKPCARNANGLCIPAHGHPVATISPFEYEALETYIYSGGENQPAPSRQAFHEQAHAFDIPLVGDTVARVVGVGACGAQNNCAISLYGCIQSYPYFSTSTGEEAPNPEMENVAKCEYWPLLRNVSGWGVANVSHEVLNPLMHMETAFVVARHLSTTETELVRYTVNSEPTGPQPGQTLQPDACQIVAAKGSRRLSHWNPAALLTQPVPCGRAFATPAR